MLLQANFAKNVRLIVILPNYYQQRLLLAHFIRYPNSGYVRFDNNALNKAEILQQVQVALGAISPQKVTHVILDECDRIPAPTLDDVLLNLLQFMPLAQIVIFSRQLPHLVINNPQIRAITQIIPFWHEAILPADNKPKVIVYALGRGRVYVNGKEITEWNGQLSRNLFFYMIDNPVITRDVIFQTFWEDMSIADATNVFHVTKRNIHNALGFELIEFPGAYYRLRDNVDLYYDVADFFDKSERGMHERDMVLLKAAYELFKYPFLQGTTMEWVETRREQLELQYSDAMSVLADHKMEVNDLDAALGLNISILSRNRGREDLATRIMRLYIQHNQPCDALKIYNQTAQFLQATQGMQPDKPLREVAEEAGLLCEQQGTA
jgi:two-component SAPR family response regulator